ncbi:hypothetical protein HC341_15785 [Aquisalimonas sp. 2447]|uniref:NfeD family protein n=1 Tax=Aquisalimonas sp. 2447 TaxID=2740807 RepID=UPI0014323816|nr:hypothetical protein [Aquisalimonas sp. 2447]QIT56528.1 hypothetical protein HC341_15785 [Aquisalimonas sp. 2447]
MEFLDPWLWWLLAALALLIIDLLVIGGSGGFLLALAVMAFAGLIAALVGASLVVQMATAAVTGIVALPVLLWAFGAMAKGSPETGNDDPRLRTTPAVVTEHNGQLGVYFLGDFFPARHTDNSALVEGEEVLIDHFQGITAMVRPVNEAADSSTNGK